MLGCPCLNEVRNFGDASYARSVRKRRRERTKKYVTKECVSATPQNDAYTKFNGSLKEFALARLQLPHHNLSLFKLL